MNLDNLLLQEITAVQVSPEWVYAKAQTEEMLTEQINAECGLPIIWFKTMVLLEWCQLQNIQLARS